uniref:2',3'-cyclic-nucleotide 3'-phosphodiesterase n=1 Tax=Rhipicephalus appendiculatus TaxID=34631 RepID=A0A131YAX6_RHIAP
MEAGSGDAGGADCPTDTTQLLDRVDVPCLKHEATLGFLRSHGRVFILVRGPPGSGKNIVAAELEELYPDCRSYWSDKLFSSPVAPERSTVSIRESHDLCLSKIEGFMKNDVPVIINRNTNVMVWEIAKFLVLASRYGYTVILVDMPHHFVLDPKVLTATNNKGLGESYITQRVRQWEEVHPFATGWSPRPRDAAKLLHRYRQLRKVLHDEDPALAPKDVASSNVFPFCLARVCVFGRTTPESNYCTSEKVKKAYGRHDTVRVFGYAVTRGFVFAMAELTEDQASLVKGRDSDSDAGKVRDEEVNDLAQRMCLSLSPANWEDISCIVDLGKFAASEKCGGDDEEDSLRRAQDKTDLKGTHPSRITIMPLGSVDGTEYSFARAVGAPWTLLAEKLRSWTAPAAEEAAKKVGDVQVYADTESRGEACCLLVDDETVELDVVFTGYYQPHTTPLSRNTWSLTRNFGRGRPRGRRSYDRDY